jgi:hypothetical protein
MTDQRDQTASFAITTAVRGRATLGPGTALVDDDMLRLLLLESPTGEKSLQVRYETIKEVSMDQTSVTLTLYGGAPLTLSTSDAAALRARLLAACRSLPEVTRALRALGSRRATRGTRRNPTDKEARFFAPLIAARRASMDAREASAVIGAFEARRLAAQISAIVRDFAAEGAAGHPARRRALEAELSDASEQLSKALGDLDHRAREASKDVDDLDRWRSWAAAVQLVFETADRSWTEIEPIVNR